MGPSPAGCEAVCSWALDARKIFANLAHSAGRSAKESGMSKEGPGGEGKTGTPWIPLAFGWRAPPPAAVRHMVPNMDMTELESTWRRQAPSAKTLRRQASPCSFRRWCWPSSCLIRTARSPFTQRPTNWWRKAGLAKRGGRERGHHLRREARKRTGKQEAFAHLRPGSSLRLISLLEKRKRKRGRSVWPTSSPEPHAVDVGSGGLPHRLGERSLQRLVHAATLHRLGCRHCKASGKEKQSSPGEML